MRPKPVRSRFLVGGSAAAVAVVCGPAPAAQFAYKLAHAVPVDNPTHVAVTQMASAIKRETGGRLEIQIFPNGVLGSQASVLSQVRLGSIQFLWINMTAYASVVPVAQLSGMGFAFSGVAEVTRAFDGKLGAYVRQEIAAKGLHAFEKAGTGGFRQMSSYAHPIRTVDDMVGYRVRTIGAPMFIDLFKTLGASPVALSPEEQYTAVQTHLIDGVEIPLVAIESFRIYEVVRYISITNHIWSGDLMIGNEGAWNALPPDIQAVVNRNQAKYALQERRDSALIEASVTDLLRRQGQSVNTADVRGMRARLGPYYAKWKAEFGSTAWSLLEDAVGKLG